MECTMLAALAVVYLIVCSFNVSLQALIYLGPNFFFFFSRVGVELYNCLQGQQELGLAVNPGGSRRWNFDNELKKSW